ncbi:GspE/PulE family protein [Hydrogenophilus hirschii]|jgi:type II secretory ATPase GspE/PulE/Tfp pilus assembly ATPase PilB-like protein
MTEPTVAPRKRLGEILIERGVLTPDQLQIALFEQQRLGKPIGETLLALGFVTEDLLSEALSENLGQEAIDLEKIVPDPQALGLIPKEIARRYAAFPVSFDTAAKQLIVAIADPNDIIATDRIRTQLGSKAIPVWRFAPRAAIEQAIDQFYGRELSLDGILRELAGESDLSQFTQEDAQSFAHPIVRLVDALLTDAVLQGASDIHFEPEPAFVRIRYRIDGVLQQRRALHRRYWNAILVRLKILAGMNIAENRAPQDGRIQLTLAGREIDFRASSQPTLAGENFVLRILDSKRSVVPLDALGLHNTQLALLKRLLARPEGILLVTGPTGSGKTTTLYSILNHLNSEQVNIMTLEDPVEYVLPLVRQTSIGETSRIDFAEGIRSLLRQDPDIILVGEIRDHDTAIMAFRAAMTGHQVFSTLHTNSALRSIPRLLDLGISPEIMAGNVIGIIAQRLVRRLCSHCKEPEPNGQRLREMLRLEAHEVLYRAVGCAECGMRGYKGRLALMEILAFDAGLDELIARRATLRELTEYTAAHGFITLAQDGLRRIREGVTTLEEVARVVDITGWFAEA